MSETNSHLTKNTSKLIRSLSQKKFRIKHQLFIAEGVKIVAELLNEDSYKIKQLFATKYWLSSNKNQIKAANFPVVTISEKELQQVSSLKTPNQVLAIVEIPPMETAPKSKQAVNILLDGVRDPGNLGAIIRIADWYGLEVIYCSKESVDCYNSKVIMAAMGSLFRVKVNYVNLETFLNTSGNTTYGTFLEGSSLNKTNWQLPCNLIMGNEANGISADLESAISQKVNIPKLGKAESLNLSVATGIFINEILKQN